MIIPEPSGTEGTGLGCGWAGLRGWGVDQELPLPVVAVTCGPWGHGGSCGDLLSRLMARAGMFGG